MVEHEPIHATSKTTAATSTSLIPKPKLPSNGGHYCRILRGKPKGRGLAEIVLDTKQFSIAVGMQGQLVRTRGTFKIISVRPGVATARLEGMGVEKLPYDTLIALVDPSEDEAKRNEQITANPPKVDVDEARVRWSGAGQTGGGPR